MPTKQGGSFSKNARTCARRNARPNDDFANGVYSVNLKYVLRQIQSYSRYTFHGVSLLDAASSSDSIVMFHDGAEGRSTPSNSPSRPGVLAFQELACIKMLQPCGSKAAS